MSKLYEVEIIVRAVVVAENMQQAFIAAERNKRAIVRDDDLDCDVVCEIKGEGQLPFGWDIECIPYGGDNNTRIGIHLENAPPERDTKTIDMFTGVQP